MTLNVQEGDLHSTVMMIAAVGGLNVSIDDSVKGVITIMLEDIEPREALNIVALTKDLQIIDKGGTLIITSNYGYNALMDSYVFVLKYADAESISDIIIKSLSLNKTDNDTNETRTIRNADGSREEYKLRGNKTEQRKIEERVTINKDSNAIILYGTQLEYERAKKILSELDVPPNQTSSMRTAYVLPIQYGNAEVYRQMILNMLNYNQDSDKLEMDTNGSNNDNTNSTTDSSIDVYDDGKIMIVNSHINNDNNGARRVMINKDTNTLILYGTQFEYERAKKFLSELDVPLKQVSIEAKIVAINKAATKDLGIDWFWSTIPQYAEYNPSTTTRGDNTTETTEGYYTRNQNEQTGFGVLQFGRVPGTPNLSYEWYFGARLNALITNGKAKMLSRPNIMTVQGHEAVINVGSSVPVPRVDVSNSITTTSIEYKDAGIILRVTPRVNADGSITANILTGVSTPQYVADLKAYQFHTRSAFTTVTMQDSQPIVIGGLIGQDEEKSIRKIPFLGDLPILGALFKSVRKNKSDSELVIFLSAHVLDS